jgi:cytochrome c-type biogenesis protein CcmH
MLFWFFAALLTLGASLAVLLPLAGRSKAVGNAGAHDLEVYRDQLAELDRDAARGLIHASEAEQARTEIARRILKAGGGAGEGEARAAPGKNFRMASAAAVLAVPLASWGIYAAIGSPEVPSQPLAERLTKNPADSTVDELVARAEQHLAENPDDGRGWDVLAPIYLRMNRFDQSVNAFRNAIRLDGSTAARETGLGEAMVSLAGGVVSKDAQEAFERAVALEPQNPKANFYLATGLAQEGRTADAIARWQAMLALLPAQTPWRQASEQAIAQASAQLASADRPAAPGPDQAQMDAAAEMPASDRTAMIEGMVASLDQKLRDNPDDAEGWTRLVRSYVVLGRADDARDAVKRGVAALGAGSDRARLFLEFSAALGVAATD